MSSNFSEKIVAIAVDEAHCVSQWYVCMHVPVYYIKVPNLVLCVSAYLDLIKLKCACLATSGVTYILYTADFTSLGSFRIESRCHALFK